MLPAAMASMPSDDDEEPINEYEQQRLDRIARNKAELERLGIPDTIASMQQQIRAKKRQKTEPSARPPKVPSEPTRRSTRQKGVPAAPIQDIIEAAPIRRPSLAPSVPKCDAEDPNDPQYVVRFHNLNDYRIKTMSEDALRRRIHNITRPDKMRSFVEVLHEKGMEELAGEAEERLKKLLKHK